MKKFLRILFFVLLALFVIILTVPFLFRGKIMEVAKREVNNNVRATVDWSDLSVSLFKGFPDLEVALKNVSVIGIDKFRGDTLMAFDRFAARIELIPAFSGNIRVKSLILERPVIRAIALKDGSVNWDITYPSTDSTEMEEPADTTSSEFVVDLKKFRVNNASIHYTDEALNLEADFEQLNLSLSGNFSGNYSDMDLNSDAKSVTINYDGTRYISRASMTLKALIGADLAKSIYTLKENELRVNDLVLGMDGSFAMPSDSVYKVDMKYYSKETAFKSVLSMIPAVYMQDFQGLKASGTLSLDGTIKGLVTETIVPTVTMHLAVQDGHFAYPDLPKSADNIQMDLKVYYDGTFEDSTRIDLDRFHIEMAGNPVDMNFHLLTPFSDMQMNGSVSGKLDLASISDVIPLDSMNLNGIITANLQMMGRMSDIENENYEAFQADGNFEVRDMEISGAEIPEPVKIGKGRLVFSPEFVNLEYFDATVGSSDVHMEGRLENFIPYIFKDETIRGNLKLTSNLLDLNALMASGEEDVDESMEDTSALTVFEVPQNIDFTLTTDLAKLNYDNLEITRLKGGIVVNNGILNMNSLSMLLLGGSMTMSGTYNTRDVTTPLLDMDLDMSDIDFPSAFAAFNTVQKLAPVAEMCRGKFSTRLQLSSLLDSAMNPVMNSMNGKGVLKTGNVEILNNKTLDKVADVLKNEKLRNPSLSDVDLSFEIRDGRVYVAPFETKLGPSKVTIGGDQGLDETMNYLMNFSIPRNEFGSQANDVLENLTAQARDKGFDVKPGENINVQVKITGTFSDPKISLAVKENLQKAKQEIREAVEQRVKEEVEKAKEEIKKDVSAEVERIMKDAQEQADQLKKSAAEAGESLVGEARLRKKQLVKEAGSNPLKKLAAEKTGDGLISQSEKQAEKLKKEAGAKADAIMETARKKADELQGKKD